LAATDAEPAALEPDALPLIEPEAEPEPAEPLPVELVLALPDGDVLPDGEVVLAALFSLACPVTLSLQCVAAEMLELPVAGGELVDCAATPNVEPARKAAVIANVFRRIEVSLGYLPATSGS